MSKRILFLAFATALCTLPSAQAAPSVWEQMQHGSAASRRGIVKSVDLLGTEIYLKVEVKDALGDKIEKLERLCSTKDGYDSVETDIMAATLYKARLDLVNEARRTGKPIEFGNAGIWKSCISFLRPLES